MLLSGDPGLPADDAHARRTGPDRSGDRADLLRFAHRDAIGDSRRVRRILCSGLFERLDKPGKGAGGFLGDAEHPQCFGDAPTCLAPDRIFRHQRENGENYLKAPVALKPFSTVEVFVPTTDVRGGTGANFVVDWAATGEIAEPVVEALMFGGLGSGHYAFISQGRPLKVVGKN